MCGIFGFKSFLTKDDQSTILRKMGERIIHRGPDDEGYFQHNDMAMGMRRLSIIDLDTGKQPIYSNDGNYVIVYNGEVYNFKELKADLQNKGYHFNTQTDTEVVVNMYQEKGVDCLHDFNGMFAFAIYDINKDELFIARDRFGIKPLYFTFQNSTFIFGSELKAILEYPNINTTISLEALDLYLTLECVPAPWSIYENIYKLEQGHYLLLCEGKLTNKQWYRLTYQPKFESHDTQDYLDELDNLIDKAVRRRTISDVPLGAFLSGGIDSSMISYYLSKHSNRKVKTFSIGFDEPSFDESQYARHMAEYLGTDHHELIFSTKEMIDIMPEIFNNMDEPFADASLLPTYMLSKFTRQNVTVSLSGDGGDEVFAGYPTYYARKLAEWIPSSSHKILKFISNLLPVSDANISFDFKIKKFAEGLKFNPDLRNQIWLGSFNINQKKQLFSKNVLSQLCGKDYVSGVIDEHMKECDTEDNWERSLWLDMRFYLQDTMLVKVDRTSMMTSLEARVPLLDHEVVEYVLRIPAGLKYKGGTSKYIFKQLAKRYVPANIINRPKKGFGIPISKWIKKELNQSFMDSLDSQKIKRTGFFNDVIIDQLMQTHQDNKKDNRKLLWVLYVFQNWIENKS